MTRVLIPRASMCSAKTVDASDWELYFCHVRDNILTGFCLSAPCPAALEVDIAAGTGRLKGLTIDNTTSCTLMCLTACNTNYIYTQLNRDACCEPINWTFTSNTTGCTPMCAMVIGRAITNMCTVTSTNEIGRTNGTGFLIDAPTSSSTWPSLDSCCNIYCTNDVIFINGISHYVNSKDRTCDPQLAKRGNITTRLSDGFCSYGTQCAADSAWAPNDSCQNVVDITCDTLDLDLIANCTDDRIIYDLGGTICDSQWVLRFHINITSITNASAGNTLFGFGISDSDAAMSTATQDSIGLRAIVKTGTDTYVASHGDNTTAVGVTGMCFATTPAACDDYYVEIIRTSPTSYTVELFNCACYSCSQELETVTTLSAATDGLRYIGIWNEDNATDNARIQGTIDDVEFYCGVTSV